MDQISVWAPRWMTARPALTATMRVKKTRKQLPQRPRPARAAKVNQLLVVARHHDADQTRDTLLRRIVVADAHIRGHLRHHLCPVGVGTIHRTMDAIHHDAALIVDVRPIVTVTATVDVHHPVVGVDGIVMVGQDRAPAVIPHQGEVAVAVVVRDLGGRPKKSRPHHRYQLHQCNSCLTLSRRRGMA